MFFSSSLALLNLLYELFLSLSTLLCLPFLRNGEALFQKSRIIKLNARTIPYGAETTLKLVKSVAGKIKGNHSAFFETRQL